jgi:hypothetical protein
LDHDGPASYRVRHAERGFDFRRGVLVHHVIDIE